MLCGKGAVAIWNGISEEGRLDFYQWHIHEHMPERTEIPGFLRGRRYRAVDNETHPEFFTLYEVEQFDVITGEEYAKRLNAPTPWTRRTVSHFLNTSRGLARVLLSEGPGPGGVLATVRFQPVITNDQQLAGKLSSLVSRVMQSPLMTGAHLCKSDEEATGVRTAESHGRADLSAPPNWFMLLEACTLESLEAPVQAVLQHPDVQNAQVGRYSLEYTRLKTDSAAG
ncbi:MULTISPECIES: hypothetical protein [unclassified Mesorhizobium]|uniref:hypothetical protein n=1 Tax=unclassified Mesorhizobium TaxID=325217 RepID=UPI000FD92431|nr:MULTISPECIES: hypothetical protein [unclassified Mesorhizobium]RWE22633.1 MAG: hypothetical protein EOS41_24010 [Mesorhizobium sp.]TGQ19126.1 hypothetical protein EN860_022025 [Mesorhizobium sp. M00.F.Ca.ET.217.01.1.1]TGV90015.1 hypothetical protein EN801_020350 [Mesorhizobium sp. M00.F.Ca.ET.158.01.1.1]